MMNRGSNLKHLYGPTARNFADDKIALAQSDDDERNVEGKLFELLCFPRWFDRNVFECAVASLDLDSNFFSFDEFCESEYVDYYAVDSFYISESVRYGLLDQAFLSREAKGIRALSSLVKGLKRLARTGYDDPRGVSDTDHASSIYYIEALYVSFFVAENLRDELDIVFSEFLDWKREPIRNSRLNRRLVKALADHIRTGLIRNEFEKNFLYMLKSTTPPWDSVSDQKISRLYQMKASEELGPLPRAYCLRELALSLSVLEQSDAELLFRGAIKLFADAGELFWAADTKRYFGKYLIESGRVDEAKPVLSEAIRDFENQDLDARWTRLLLSECKRLLAWGEYYKGSEGRSRAFEMARHEIVSLLRDGELHQAALFSMLLARESWLRLDFSEALSYLDDALSVLSVSGDSIDLANCYLQRAATIALQAEQDSRLNWSDQEEGVFSDILSAKKIFDNKGSAKSLPQIHYWTSVALYLSRKPSEALEQIDLAISGFSERGDASGLADGLFRKGLYQIYRGDDYESVLAVFQEFEAIAESAGSVNAFFERIRAHLSIENELQDKLISIARGLGLKR